MSNPLQIMRLKRSWKISVLTILILIVIYLAADTLPSLQAPPGKTDYLGYWSASFLLSQKENFSDDLLILKTQEAITNSTREYPIKSWNPPWLLAWLLPYTLVGFEQAATLWLVTSFLLVFVSAVLIWQIYVPLSVARHWFWLPIAAAILYPFTLTALVVGQVNLLILFGLAAFLYLYLDAHDFGAGIALSLTMVKPQLVYLTVPLILLSSIRHRRWRILQGFSTMLLVSIFVVAILRPTFLGEYYASVSGGGLLNYLSPTIPVVLSVFLNFLWIRLIGLLLLPLAIWLWFRHQKQLAMGQLIDISVLASVITAPFLWSYDYVVLLIPLIRVWIWMIDGVLSLVETIGLAIGMMALYIFLYQKRIETPSEMYYAWFPLLVAVLYSWLWFRNRRRNQGKAAGHRSSGDEEAG